jgi:hypothetical protein
MTLNSDCYRQTLLVVGSLPTSWIDALHASLKFPIILGLPSLSSHQFDGDMLY